jgi:hypothetical protein
MTIDKKLVRQAVPYMLVVAVAVGIVVRAESQTNAVDSRVTKVESPCLRYGPKSDECKKAFEAAVATITHPQACAIERKAGTLRAIRELAAGLEVTFREPCAGARLAQERQRGSERAATSRERKSEQAPAPAPASGGSGGAPGSGTPADTQPPAPHHPGSHPAHQPPDSGSEGGGGPVDQGTGDVAGSTGPTGGVGESTRDAHPESVLESAAAGVGDVVSSAGQVLESATCGLSAPLLCPKP